ncbi:hypothetical protein C3K47_12105 [Solitalea longa]|uniref:Putative auto-transporter adhesin head GIN domain-containing protein n=1 Tax=Solitalea longa TaxID=2079460 RepID=A0A2S5A0Z7_9SPHI|nr:DUF2807 domain-containing protein [Solitalea longa]POY35947.1 hypothetical protein C3K47_12105 [Solitalea longa]
MKTLSKLIACVALFTFFWTGTSFAADHSKKTQFTYQLKQFSKVNVHGNVRVLISNSDKNQLTLISKEAFVKKQLRFEVKNGELQIFSTADACSESPIVILNTCNLTSIAAEDNASIESGSSAFSALELSVDLSGNSTANLDLNVFELTSKVVDGSSIVVKGSADTHTIKTDRSACIDGSLFVVSKCFAELNGINSFKAFVKDTFDYENDSASKVSFAGNTVYVSSKNQLN